MQQNTIDLEKRKLVMAKLEKILAHTGDGAVNENEVEVANKLAKSLMEEYGITLGELNKVEHKIDLVSKSYVGFDSEPDNWAGYLAMSISRFYECKPLKSYDGFYFVGFDVDVNIASKMFKDTYDRILKQSRIAVPKFLTELNGPGIKKLRRDFCMGAVFGLDRKLEAMEDERIRSLNALVVVKKEVVEEKFKEFFPDTEPVKHRSINLSGAYNQGIKFGKTLKVHEEISK